MLKLNKLSELKGFLIFWCSQSFSMLGTAMTNYALILQVYGQQRTVTSIAVLTACSMLPSILFCFIAGAIADRWDKRKLILLCTLVASAGTIAILTLYSAESLQIGQLYVINLALGFVSAFQNPVVAVSVTLLSPQAQYTRVGGIMALTKSLISISAPLLATAILAVSDIRAIFIVDLASFALAFFTLRFIIRIPDVIAAGVEKKEKFLTTCLVGLRFLRAHKPLHKIILLFALINFLAYLTGYGILPALILSRSGGDSTTLGMVTSAVGIGTLAGSILVTLIKLPGSRTKVIFLFCAISFVLSDILWGLGQVAFIWVFAAFIGNVPIPFLNANMSALMRENVPIELQGRVFAARDTLQYFPIPIGLFLGGYLADKVFEPFMAAASPVQQLLGSFVGTGDGSGIAVMFVITGIIGCAANLLALRNPIYKQLDSKK